MNLTPLAGVLWLGWNLSTILFLYWFENIIVGFFNILKMRIAQLPVKEKIVMPKDREYSITEKNTALIVAFVFHYGTFTFGHGLFVYFLFLKNYHVDWTLFLSIISLFISYGTAYYANYVGNKEYETISSDELMRDPYVRVIIVHTTLILGGLYILKVGEHNLSYLVILTGLVILVNLTTTLTKNSSFFSKHISFK